VTPRPSGTTSAGRPVAVLGRGLAGAAAAWAAAAQGAVVESFGEIGLATTLSSGALDWLPWEQARGRAPAPLPADLFRFFDELGGYRLSSDAGVLVATAAGVLREARGHDSHVLDLAALGPGMVLVPRVTRPGWDADALAASWSDETAARARGLTFVAVDGELCLLQAEGVMPDADLAVRLRDPSRRRQHQAALTACLARSPGALAVLVPAGFGIPPSPSSPSDRAKKASEAFLPVTAGEVLSAPGGPSGSRLAAALERVLPPARGRRARLCSPVNAQGELAVETDDGTLLSFGSVVLAVGGVLAGGLELIRTDPAAVLSPIPRFQVPAFSGAWIGGFSASHEGAVELPPDDLRWGRDVRGSLLERVGILHAPDSQQVLASRDEQIPGLFVAGDAAADRPRTTLFAVSSGLEAGQRAAARSR
jgi:glycerol-3-phosphate dehydrogenase subunit B